MKAHYWYQSTVEPPTPPPPPTPNPHVPIEVFGSFEVRASWQQLVVNKRLVMYYLSFSWVIFFFLSSQKEGIVMVPWCLIFEPPLARPPWQTVVLEMF